MHTMAPPLRPPSSDVVLALRGHRQHRPSIDPNLAGGLRAWLEDDLSEIARSLDPSTPLLLSPRSIANGPLIAVPSILGLARAALINCLVSQRLIFHDVTHPMDDALSALEAQPEQAELVEAIHGLDQASFARLSAEVAAHDEVLARHLSRVPTTWLPRTNVRKSISLAGGRIIVNAVASVELGTPSVTTASISLLDITTSNLDAMTPVRLGVIALIETLRSGAAPLRCASLSTATGEIEICDVDDVVLSDAVRHVADAARIQGGQA
jgi:hypothetical protein